MSLIVAGTLALTAVSTVIAFQGWPGITWGTGAEQADVLASVSAATSRSTHEHRMAVVVPPKPEVAAPKPTRARRPAATTVAPTPATGGGPKSTAHPAAAPRPVMGSAAPNRQPVTADKPVSTASQPVRDLGDQVGGAVANVGKSVSAVNPTVGKAVEGVTNAVGGVVVGATEIVGEIIDKLTNPPAAK